MHSFYSTRFYKIVIGLFLGSLFLTCCENNIEPDNPKDEFTALPFEEFLGYLETIDISERQELVDVYMDSLTSTPIIDGEKVFFVYVTDKQNVSVAGDFNGWNSGVNSLSNFNGTTLWYAEFYFESNARLDYKFVVEGRWLLDPKNPNKVSGGFGPNSELAMPGYVQPLEIENIGNPEGLLEKMELASSITGSTYSIDVYVPPGYNPNLSYPSVYFQDGSEYIVLGSAFNVLNNLIANNEITPIIAVFVKPNDRGAEYAFEMRMQYASFFINELVPFIDAKYSTIDNGDKRAVMGASFGGNISAIICAENPAVFGNLGLHSGAFWPNDHELTNQVTSGALNSVRVASVWGTYEADIAYDMNIVKDYMLDNNLDIFWKELPEGHSWGLWRANIDDVLKYLFPL